MVYYERILVITSICKTKGLRVTKKNTVQLHPRKKLLAFSQHIATAIIIRALGFINIEICTYFYSLANKSHYIKESVYNSHKNIS